MSFFQDMFFEAMDSAFPDHQIFLEYEEYTPPELPKDLIESLFGGKPVTVHQIYADGRPVPSGKTHRIKILARGKDASIPSVRGEAITEPGLLEAAEENQFRAVCELKMAVLTATQHCQACGEELLFQLMTDRMRRDFYRTGACPSCYRTACNMNMNML